VEKEKVENVEEKGRKRKHERKIGKKRKRMQMGCKCGKNKAKKVHVE
jgi:hypothetical protein